MLALAEKSKMAANGDFEEQIYISFYNGTSQEQHKVTTNKFLTEFANYLESLLLVKKQFLMLSDFNIHVCIRNDPDSG